MSYPRVRLINEGRDARDRVVHALAAATGDQSQSVRLSAYIAEWLERRRPQLESRTHDSYCAVTRRYIIPHLGDYDLTELTSAIVMRWCDHLRVGGGHKGKPLAVRTVRYAYSILHCALEDAIRGDLLIVNPATRAAPPRRDRASVRARKAIWNAEQLGCFLESVRGTEFGLAYHLAAATGMRRGEVLGLRWPDVVGGFDELIVRTALVRVNGEYELKPPKSRRPRRLRIDAVTAGMLERHLDVVGSSGGEWNLVFAGPDLQPLVPDHMTVDFARQVARTSLPRVRLHNLRHTHATILLEAGVPVTEVSARLGHVDPRIGPQSVRHIAVRALSPLPPLP